MASQLQVDDSTLLRRYVGERDEAAFAELVRRYANLVLASAMRRTRRRRAMAEDVTQAVFLILAKKALPLSETERSLSSWLLQCTRYSAANAVKIEARRHLHMQSLQFQSAEPQPSSPIDQLIQQEFADHLDDAVLKLPQLDRQAILLRYFEGQPLAAIAEQMRWTDGATKQRLHRALHQLRQRLVCVSDSQKRVEIEQIGTSSLSIWLTANAAGHADSAVPAAFLASIHGGIAANANSISIAKGAMAMMTWTKAKLFAAIAAAVLTVIGGAGGLIAMAGGPPSAVTAANTSTVAMASPPKAADSITVESAPPVVVKTEPQAGTVDVDASISEIKVTFSKPMADGSWSWSSLGDATTVNITDKPHYEPDGKTCVAPVKLEPGHTYAIWLNSERFGNFKDADGTKAVPYLLVFRTK